ncbi:MAG TPA: hypothetical protein VF041_16710 [Gemmatimonadaceae bacterium]
MHTGILTKSAPAGIAGRAEDAALRWGVAALALTSVHHVYGAFRYHTPWRAHAAIVAILVTAAMAGALRVYRRAPETRAGTVAWWVFWTITALVPVLFFGVFEGFYNHLAKDALYFGGLPMAQMRRLFPPPAYEMPNDVFFEVTGVLQVVPTVATAWYLALATARRGRRVADARAG